jgi:hypothetical protein
MELRESAKVGALSLAFWLATSAAGSVDASSQRLAKANESCFKHHGRLSSQNGIALMIWLIGTKRIVGLEDSVLPPAVHEYLDMASPNHSYIYGDFEICPLEPDTPGHMRRARVAGAEKLVVKNLQDSRPPFRLLSTWPVKGNVQNGPTRKKP